MGPDQADLDAVAAEINGRPRRVHGYRSATQVWNDLDLTASTLPSVGGAPTP